VSFCLECQSPQRKNLYVHPVTIEGFEAFDPTGEDKKGKKEGNLEPIPAQCATKYAPSNFAPRPLLLRKSVRAVVIG